MRQGCLCILLLLTIEQAAFCQNDGVDLEAKLDSMYLRLEASRSELDSNLKYIDHFFDSVSGRTQDKQIKQLEEIIRQERIREHREKRQLLIKGSIIATALAIVIVGWGMIRKRRNI